MEIKSYMKAAWDAMEENRRVAPILARGMKHYFNLIENAVGVYPTIDVCFVVAALEKSAEIIREINKDDEMLLELVELLKSGESTFLSSSIAGDVVAAELEEEPNGDDGEGD